MGPEIRTTFTADTVPLERGAEKAKATIQGVAATDGVGVGGGVLGVGRSIRAFTAPLTTFVGAITRTISAFSRLLGWVGLVVGTLALLHNMFQRVGGGASKTAEEIKKITETMEKWRSEKSAAAAKAVGELTGVFPDPEQLAEAQRTVAALQKQVGDLAAAIAARRRFLNQTAQTQEQRQARQLEQNRDVKEHTRLVAELVAKMLEAEQITDRTTAAEKELVALKHRQIMLGVEEVRLRAQARFESAAAARDTRTANRLHDAILLMLAQRSGRDLK